MNNNTASAIAPLQLIAIAFDRFEVSGRIADELKALREKDFIRIVDLLAIRKDQDGNVQSVETSDLAPGEAARYGAIIGALIGIGSGDKRIAQETSQAMAAAFEERYQFGLDKEDIEDLAEDIPRGGTALMLLIEHRWALPLRNAFREAGGVLLAQDFLSPELLMSLGDELYSAANA